MRPIVSVIGGERPDPGILPLAEEVGALLARAGCAVACGGLGGVMEAVCRGAHREGGLTIGILPGFQRSAANDEVDVAIVTGLGVARNVVVALTGQAVIAVDGSYGTLSEIAHTLEIGKPVVALRSWPLVTAGIDPKRYLVADTPDEAVKLALELAAKDPGNYDPFGGVRRGRR